MRSTRGSGGRRQMDQGLEKVGEAGALVAERVDAC